MRSFRLTSELVRVRLNQNRKSEQLFRAIVVAGTFQRLEANGKKALKHEQVERLN